MNISPSSQASLNVSEELHVVDQQTSNTAVTAKQRLSDDQVSKSMFVINHAAVAQLDRVEASALISKLETIIDQAGKNVDKQYPEHRISYCAIQLQLNKRFAVKEVGVPSPAFRPRFKYGRKPKGALELLSNDTQIIDMHFMHCNGLRTASGVHASQAYSGDVFDFDSAYRFALTCGSQNLKLKLLGLSNNPEVQFSLVWLKDKQQRDAVERVKEFERVSRGKLEMLGLSNSRVSKNEGVWAAVLTAERLCNWFKWKPTPKNLLLALQLCSGMPACRADKLKQKLSSARKYVNA